MGINYSKHQAETITINSFAKLVEEHFGIKNLTLLGMVPSEVNTAKYQLLTCDYRGMDGYLIDYAAAVYDKEGTLLMRRNILG